MTWATSKCTKVIWQITCNVNDTNDINCCYLDFGFHQVKIDHNTDSFWFGADLTLSDHSKAPEGPSVQVRRVLPTGCMSLTQSGLLHL